MPGALPGTALPIYRGLGQAPNMLACIPGGLVSLPYQVEEEIHSGPTNNDWKKAIS